MCDSLLSAGTTQWMFLLTDILFEKVQKSKNQITTEISGSSGSLRSLIAFQVLVIESWLNKLAVFFLNAAFSSSENSTVCNQYPNGRSSNIKLKISLQEKSLISNKTFRSFTYKNAVTLFFLNCFLMLWLTY